MLNVENLQINIPDDTVAHRATAKEAPEPTAEQHIFSQQIKQDSTISSKLTDDEKTAAIDQDQVSRKNSKNLGKGVHFDQDHHEENNNERNASKIDHDELSKEINDIIEQAVEINANNQSNKIEYDEQCMRDELCKEITNIINKAVEINAKSDGEATSSSSGHSSPTDHTINENDHVKLAAPGSPEWNYPMPMTGQYSSTEKSTISSESSSEGNYDGRREHALFTSPAYPKVNECPILPIIKTKPQLDFHDCSDNSLTTTDITAVEAKSESPEPSVEQENVITSDIEDGYLGNDVKSKQLLSQQKERDQFIENEFEFLSEHDDNSTIEQPLQQQQEERKSGATVMTTTSIDEPHMNVVNEKYSSRDETKQNGHTDVIRQKSTDSNGATVTKTDVIDELNDIINAKRLDSVIKKCEESDDIDAAKRSSLANFQIRAYTKSMSENNSTVHSKNDDYQTKAIDASDVTKMNGIERSNSLAGGDVGIFMKPREYTPMKRSSLTLPRHINRSDSFHSTHTMQSSYLQQPPSNGEPLSLTPRSSSYISLIGTQRYENKTSNKQLFGNGISETTRRKSSSELSIADSPSLQSLVVMKSILSNSRKNSLNLADTEAPLKAVKLSFDEEVPAPVAIAEPKQKIVEQPLQEKQDEILVEKETVTVVKSAAKADEPKKWTYQGPPAVSLSTWGERPKSQVQIKSDNDYKFGGVVATNKTTALQKRFSAAAENANDDPQPKQQLNKRYSTPNPIVKKFEAPALKPVTAPKPAAKPTVVVQSRDDVDSATAELTLSPEVSKEYERRITPLPSSQCKPELGTIPIVRGVEYKKNINLDEEFIKNDPIMRDDGHRSVSRSRSSYEVSRIVNERPFSYYGNGSGPASVGFDPVVSTMTLGRVPIPNKFAGNFAPQPYQKSNGHAIQRNSSFSTISTARMSLAPESIENFGETPAKQQQQPVLKQTNRSPVVVKFGTYESQPRSPEKPVFAQFTLRKTGLKEKIIDDEQQKQQRSGAASRNSTVTSPATAPAAIPPPPAFPKPINATKRTTAEPKRSYSYEPDPRNQLLDSIRNFSRNDLRKA